jgi:hypothetical protein
MSMRSLRTKAAVRAARQETMPQPDRLDRRALWIGVATFLGSLAIQVAIIAAAALRGGSSPYDGSASVLLSREHHISDLAAIAGIKCIWLLAIAMLAWPIARLWSWGIHDTWDHPNVNIAARILYPLVGVVLLVALWLVFTEQALALDRRLVSHWALFATLPHGTLEFGALLLPLSAAASCIFAPAARPGRLLLRTLSVSVPLVLVAALVEVYLTPHLLIPFAS